MAVSRAFAGLAVLCFAGAAWAADARTLTVVGRGEVRAAPDMAVISLQLQRQAPSAVAAQREVDAVADALVKLALAAKLRREDIDASQSTVQPDYDWEAQKRVFRGMSATRTLRLSVRQLAALGPLVDRLLAADASAASELQFGFADERGLRQQALDAAWADARAKAERLAAGAGAKLGAPVAIVEEGAAAPQPLPRMAMMAEAKAADLPVGERALEARLTVSFELQ